ncbi:MAG: hypothetical protein KIS73_12495 [Enhydrobacter sp.]|nr:hypothetical protein [Enhydrobacter sp.]
MNLQLPALGTFVDWACGVSKSAPGAALDQLDHDKAEAKEKICAVMAGLAQKHGVPMEEVDLQTQSFVDEALDILLCDREDELHAELEQSGRAELR